ncbi:TerB family tellurite resistance protein [uncultured Draconibacterium sp.]|uniref:TerB family tellurite resistance protein n=1 Tax=uncultured Draconibacterium sp. TaxID=1573823 RepID=UPI0032609788
MKTIDFQNFLLKSAIAVMACDGVIQNEEIEEIKNMVSNEIYFMGYDFEKPFETNLNYIKSNGKVAINEYLTELSTLNLNDKQELRLIEVLIRTIESDNKIETNEIKFIQLVKSKLKISEETIIANFPRQMSYLIDSNNYGLENKFNEEIDFTDKN